MRKLRIGLSLLAESLVEVWKFFLLKLRLAKPPIIQIGTSMSLLDIVSDLLAHAKGNLASVTSQTCMEDGEDLAPQWQRQVDKLQALHSLFAAQYLSVHSLESMARAGIELAQFIHQLVEMGNGAYVAPSVQKKADDLLKALEVLLQVDRSKTLRITSEEGRRKAVSG